MGWRISPDAYRRITAVALIALAAIIVTGGAVRLTGSGLGCSDWPTCEQGELVAPLEYHAMIEFVNRLVTGLVSIAVILAVLGSLWRRPRRRDLTWWSLGLVAGVLGQIVLGGMVVIFHLRPELVIGHFLLSMVLLWNAVVLHHKAATPDDLVPGPPRPDALTGARVMSGLAVAVLVTGTIVTGAGPHGGDEEVERLPFAVPDVARIHAIFVIAFLLTVAVVVYRLHRDDAPPATQRAAQAVLGIGLAQGLIGYVQYFSDVPVLLVGAHILGAVLLWGSVVRFHLIAGSPEPAVPAAPSGELVWAPR